MACARVAAGGCAPKCCVCVCCFVCERVSSVRYAYAPDIFYYTSSSRARERYSILFERECGTERTYSRCTRQSAECENKWCGLRYLHKHVRGAPPQAHNTRGWQIYNRMCSYSLMVCKRALGFFNYLTFPCKAVVECLCGFLGRFLSYYGIV